VNIKNGLQLLQQAVAVDLKVLHQYAQQPEDVLLPEQQ